MMGNNEGKWCVGDHRLPRSRIAITHPSPHLHLRKFNCFCVNLQLFWAVFRNSIYIYIHPLKMDMDNSGEKRVLVEFREIDTFV